MTVSCAVVAFFAWCARIRGYALSDVVFVQAEDGIRVLVRSRGLGDVYKRQELVESTRGPGGGYSLARPARDISVSNIIFAVDEPVSYTHLTLPTSDLV